MGGIFFPGCHPGFTCGCENLLMASYQSRKSRAPGAKDRRAADRYDFKTPFSYRIASADPNADPRRGATINMSSRAILAEIPEVIRPGTKLQVVIDWPGLFHGLRAVQLALTAVVVRLEGSRKALRIQKHAFGEYRPEIAGPAV